MHRAVILGGLLCGILGLTRPSVGADAVTQHMSILAGVPGLEQPVTYTETKIPLATLVRKVAADTGVALATTKDVADEPVAAVVKDLPARELLDQIAALLDYQWRQRADGGQGYVIWQDPASRQREKALRDGLFDAAERRLEEEIQRYVQVSALSPEQFREADKQFEQQLEQLTAPQREAFLRSPEGREWQERLNIAAGLSMSPIRWAAASLLGLVSPQQWAGVLHDGRPLVFSTRPRAGELPLSATVARSLAALQPSVVPPGTILNMNGPAADQALRRHEKDLQDGWAAASGFRVTIQRQADRFTNGSALSLIVSVLPIQSSGVVPTSFLEGSSATSLPVRAEPVDPKEQPGQPVASQGAVASGGERLPDLLPALARAYGVSFIADAYWSTSRVAGGPITAAEHRPLSELLDSLAAPTYAWDQRGRLVRLRSRSWYLDRPREIPVRLLRRWQNLCEQHGSLPLDEWLNGVATLSDEQLESLAGVARETQLPPEFYTAYLARQALRLYASLTPAQRQALAQGKAIPVPELLPRQRDLFLAALQEGHRLDAPPIRLSSVGGGSLSLIRGGAIRIGEREGETISYRTEPVTAEQTPVNSGAPEAGPPAGTPASPPAAGSAGASKIALHPVTELTLLLQYGPGMRECVCITTTPPPPSGAGVVDHG